MARQLALPLEPRAEYEIAMMRAWTRSGMRVPYHVAVRIPALAICLRNMASAERRRNARRSRLQPAINNGGQESVDSIQAILAN